MIRSTGVDSENTFPILQFTWQELQIFEKITWNVSVLHLTDRKLQKTRRLKECAWTRNGLQGESVFNQLGTNDKEFKYLEFSCTTISVARILEPAILIPLNENCFPSFNHFNTSSFFCSTYIICFVLQQ